MKKSAKTDLRAKSSDDLKVLAKSARDGLLKARISKSVEGKAITIKYRDVRRQIARLETLITEKSVAGKGTK